MEAVQLQHELEEKSYTEMEIFTEVLGTKTSYVRGLGCLVRSIGSSSSTLSVGLSWRLKEARLEIEEMRARQMKYEVFLSNGQGADDARALADDGGATVEEK
ncbi:hypothetical protein CJ030_MR5G003408 [Morella rubra]|uniref:Uncharacterized protein n=1 Tax=Morella rubra TaxID=262757 RepID=A0A6A1VKT0_9ROSI|nr:hypothetical protein CJ030_MR5G003408 [Morella rubra]